MSISQYVYNKTKLALLSARFKGIDNTHSRGEGLEIFNIREKNLFGLIFFQQDSSSATRFSPRGVLPYIGYIGMCGAKGYVFLAVFV